MQVSTKPVVKGKRPLGVWILTGYAIVFAGLGPVSAAVMLLILGDEAQAAGLGPMDWLLPLVLGICVTVAGIGAWRGSNRARIALVALVTVHYVLIAINNLLWLGVGSVPDAQQVTALGRVVRGVLYPAVYIWYFRRLETKEFYESAEQV